MCSTWNTKVSLAVQAAWSRFGEFMTQRASLARRDWLSVRDELWRIEDFLNQWSKGTDGQLSGDPVAIILAKEIDSYRSGLLRLPQAGAFIDPDSHPSYCPSCDAAEQAKLYSAEFTHCSCRICLGHCGLMMTPCFVHTGAVCHTSSLFEALAGSASIGLSCSSCSSW